MPLLKGCLLFQLTLPQEGSWALATSGRQDPSLPVNSFHNPFRAHVTPDVFKAHIPQGKASHVPTDAHSLLGQSSAFHEISGEGHQPVIGYTPCSTSKLSAWTRTSVPAPT